MTTLFACKDDTPEAGGDGARGTRAAEGAGTQIGTGRMVSRAVRRAQEGDREAIGFLYARYSENVYGYVRSIVKDHYEAEDVTQQVFAKLVRVIGSYEEREVPFFAWKSQVQCHSLSVRLTVWLSLSPLNSTVIACNVTRHGSSA